MAPVLGYWKLRGLAQHIRLLLEYVGEEYVDKHYHAGPAPDYYDKSDWKLEKFTLGLPFPNIPYYIDGDIKLSQSNAILYHLGRKYKLAGNTEKEKMDIDVLINQAFDFRMKYAFFAYMHYDDEAKREQYVKKDLPEQLKLFSDFLGNKKFFIGNQVMLPDFVIYEILDVQLKVDPNCLKPFKNLQDFHKRFEDLPAIKKYMSSPRFIRAPLNGPMAKFDIK